MATMLYGSRAEEPEDEGIPYCPLCLTSGDLTPVNRMDDLCDKCAEEQSLYRDAERMYEFDEE